MSYYMRMEDADGNLIVGTEIDHEGSDATVGHWIDKMRGEFIGKVKLYDLSNPTQTVEVDDANNRSDRTDATGSRDEEDGQVRGNK